MTAYEKCVEAYKRIAPINLFSSYVDHVFLTNAPRGALKRDGDITVTINKAQQQVIIWCEDPYEPVIRFENFDQATAFVAGFTRDEIVIKCRAERAIRKALNEHD